MTGDFQTVPDRVRGGGGDSGKWAKYRGKDILPAWVADMDFPAAPPVLRALAERVQHGIFGYAEPTDELAETVVRYFDRKWGWKIQPEWIVWSPGLGASIHTVCRMAGEPGDDILTPAPIYHVFRKAPAMAGRNRVDIPMTLAADGEWKLDIAALEQAAGPRARVLQLCNPHNPNGKVFSADELAALAEFSRRKNLILCADEVHADLILEPNARHHCIAALDEDAANRSIVLQSPSKAYNVAGLNFAVVVIPNPDLRRRYRETAAGQVISHLNPMGMVAARAAWGGECDEWLREAILQLRKNRDELARAAREWNGVEMPRLDSTYLAWLDVRGLGVENPPAHFEAHGVGMSPGEVFGDPGWMRLNFGCPPETLREIIRRVGNAAGKA